MTTYHCPLCDKDIGTDEAYTVVPPSRMHTSCYEDALAEDEKSKLPSDPYDFLDPEEKQKLYGDLREMQRQRWRAEAECANMPMA